MLAIPNLSEVILHSINLPMLVVDGDNRLIEANSAAEEFLQMGRRSLMHQPLGQIFPPPCVLAEMLEKPRLTAASVSDQNIEIISLNIARQGAGLGESAPVASARPPGACGDSTATPRLGGTFAGAGAISRHGTAIIVLWGDVGA